MYSLNFMVLETVQLVFESRFDDYKGLVFPSMLPQTKDFFSLSLDRNQPRLLFVTSSLKYRQLLQQPFPVPIR